MKNHLKCELRIISGKVSNIIKTNGATECRQEEWTVKKIAEWFRQFRWQNFVLLIVAGILSAVGVTMFLEPVALYDSGISGTSMLLGQLTPDYLKRLCCKKKRVAEGNTYRLRPEIKTH